MSVEQFGCTPELYDALDHDRVWEHIPGTRPKSPESLAALLTVPERQPLIIRDRGAIVGTSSYLFDPDRSHEVEIGATLLTPSAWGTGVNAQAKHIMVDAAFSAGAEWVLLRTDEHNARSAAAILKLPRAEEIAPVIESQIVRADGTVRTSRRFRIVRP